MRLPTHRQEVLRDALYWAKVRAIHVRVSPEYLAQTGEDGRLTVWQHQMGENLAFWKGRCEVNGWNLADISEGWPCFVDAFWADMGDVSAQTDLARWTAEAYPESAEPLSIGDERTLRECGLVMVEVSFSSAPSWCWSWLDWPFYAKAAANQAIRHCRVFSI